MRGHLRDGRVRIGLLRAERQPAGQPGHRGDRFWANMISKRRAVVVDQPRLDDGVAHAGVVAPGQHVVVAQQVLALRGVLNQRAQRAAAAIDDLLAARVVVAVVAARTAQWHKRRQLALMRGRVARDPGGIHQHHRGGSGTRNRAGPRLSHCGHHIGCAGGLNRGRRRVCDCA